MRPSPTNFAKTTRTFTMALTRAPYTREDSRSRNALNSGVISSAFLLDDLVPFRAVLDRVFMLPYAYWRAAIELMIAVQARK